MENLSGGCYLLIQVASQRRGVQTLSDVNGLTILTLDCAEDAERKPGEGTDGSSRWEDPDEEVREAEGA